MALHFIFLMAQQGGEGPNIVSTLIMFGLIFVIFYFMIIRPQQKRSKERQSMLDSVKKGDKIVTAGGLHGVVVGVEDKSLLVQIADNVKVKVERSGIGSITRESEQQTPAPIK